MGGGPQYCRKDTKVSPCRGWHAVRPLELGRFIQLGRMEDTLSPSPRRHRNGHDCEHPDESDDVRRRTEANLLAVWCRRGADVASVIRPEFAPIELSFPHPLSLPVAMLLKRGDDLWHRTACCEHQTGEVIGQQKELVEMFCFRFNHTPENHMPHAVPTRFLIECLVGNSSRTVPYHGSRILTCILAQGAELELNNPFAFLLGCTRSSW